MNKLTGQIKHIESTLSMSVVDISVGKDTFSVIVIDTPKSANYLKNAQPINLLFKETEVVLAKNLTTPLSIPNRFKGKITHINEDKLLTQITINYQQTSIISMIITTAYKNLNIKTGDEIDWLIESNEIILSL